MATGTVTVLFTDLVESTALLSRVGEDQAEVLRREHFALLRDAIGTHDGREVKNVGDGVMVVFDGITAAVACAVEMQQQIELRNRNALHELQVRVGVSHGEADIEDDDYFGVPVVEAARLCGHADGGEILVSEIVRILAGSRGDFDFESLGVLLLKGLDRSGAACRVRWIPIDTGGSGGVPIPPRVTIALSDLFVGRANERALLNDALKSAAGGDRHLVLLSGEPGIGKTSLAAACAREAWANGAIVAYGRSDEDLGIPYQPWVEALTHVIVHLDDEVLVDHVARRGGRLAHLVPELRERVPMSVDAPSADAEAERYLLFGDAVDLLAKISERAQVVLILDDLHWADKPTLQLLRHLVASTEALHVLIVGTFRESDIGADHPLSDALAALHREHGVQRLALHGLDDTDLLALLEATAGHEMDDDGVALRDALASETDGNPFFVSEILRHLADTGAIRQDENGRWFASMEVRDIGLPVSVREVVGQRVKRLGQEVLTVLSTASVIGRDFDSRLLAATTQASPGELLDLLDAAVEAGLLTEPHGKSGGYSFAHALIEHTLYSDLTANRRAHLHRVVAEQLEALYGDALDAHFGELAWHWSEATTAIDVDKPVDYARRAGEQALAQLAPDEAQRWFSHALDLLSTDRVTPDEELRCSLLVGLGEAQRQIGDAGYRQTLLDAAELAGRHGLDDLLVRSALANNRGLFSAVGDVDDARLEVLRAALAAVPLDQHDTRAKLLALLAVESTFGNDLPERQSLARQAVDAARATNDAATLAEVLARTHVAIQVPQTLAERLVSTAEACDLAAALDDPFLEWLTQTVRLNSAFDAGDIDTHDRCLAAATAAAERLGQPHPLWEARFSAATSAMLRGDPTDGEQKAAEALEIALEAGEPDAFTVYGVQLVAIRWQQGRLDELISLVRQAAAEQPRVPGFRAMLAWVLAGDGQLDEAREHVDRAKRDDFALLHDLTWLFSSCLWAEAVTRVHDPEGARVLFDRLEPWSAQFGQIAASGLGATAHYLGMLAACLEDDEGVVRYFTQALDIHTAMRAPFLVANTQVQFASVLLQRATPGDRERAQALLQAAADLARGRFAGLERAIAAWDLGTS